MATRTRQKAEKIANNKDKRPYAVAKYVRISPSKARIVLNCIRGKNAVEAVAILENMPDFAGAESLKVLNSAIANAENNMGLNRDDLFVAECYATQGSTMRRMQPVSKGRGHAILKRTSHIKIILGQKA